MFYDLLWLLYTFFMHNKVDGLLFHFECVYCNCCVAIKDFWIDLTKD